MPGTTQIEDQDHASVTHLLISSLHLGIGAVLTLLALIARAFPDVFPPVVGYGRSHLMAMNAIIVGWLVVGFIGAAYHMLPRLTGARLWNESLATNSGRLLGLLALGGIVVIALGLGDGSGPLGLPWWYDLVIAAVLLIPLAVTTQTLRQRSETGVFPSLWFIVAGMVSLPILAFASAIPYDGGLGEALRGVLFDAGFSTLWVTMMGAGVGFYVAVRATSNPLANRQLARTGYLSLLFAGVWAGAAQIAFAPYPTWLAQVSAALTLALVVAALTNGLGIAQTVDDGWRDSGSQPALGALAAGIGFMVVAAVATSVGTFSSASAMVGLTTYWDGVEYLVLFGVGGMFMAAWAYQTLPAMTGRAVADPSMATRQVRWTLWFVGGTGLLLIVGGIAAGIGMTGGGYGGMTPDKWGEMTSTGTLFSGLAVLTGLGAFASQGLFSLNVYRTLTSGAATTQEVLVERQS